MVIRMTTSTEVYGKLYDLGSAAPKGADRPEKVRVQLPARIEKADRLDRYERRMARSMRDMYRRPKLVHGGLVALFLLCALIAGLAYPVVLEALLAMLLCMSLATAVMGPELILRALWRTTDFLVPSSD